MNTHNDNAKKMIDNWLSKRYGLKDNHFVESAAFVFTENFLIYESPYYAGTMMKVVYEIKDGAIQREVGVYTKSTMLTASENEKTYMLDYEFCEPTLEDIELLGRINL